MAEWHGSSGENARSASLTSSGDELAPYSWPCGQITLAWRLYWRMWSEADWNCSWGLLRSICPLLAMRLHLRPLVLPASHQHACCQYAVCLLMKMLPQVGLLEPDHHINGLA